MTEPSTSAAPPAETPRPRIGVRDLPSLWFGLSKRVTRGPYLITGVLLMAVKYGTDVVIVYGATHRLFTPLDYLNPLLFARNNFFKQALGGPEASPEGLLIVMGAIALPFLWIGVSMSIRRAADAGLSPWAGLAFFVPVVNYLMMIALAALPSKERASSWPAETPPPVVDDRLRSGLLGVVVGLAIAGGMTLLSVFVIGNYGASLFLGTPVAMGAAAAWLHNRKHPRSLKETVFVAVASVSMAGACLLLFALEGVFCLAMAFPIACALSILGALVGRSIALRTHAPAAHALIAALSLPVLCGAEGALRVAREHEVSTVQEINAPPEVVWRHVVSFTELPPPSEWFFDAGIAYPLRARIEGTGVGAVRHCEFSTGAFVEPITTWDEPHRLSFNVTSQPQPMKEWSPYAFVNAPHLDHALRSQRGEFRLIPLDGGKRTRLEGSTWYVLDMAPAPYWRIWSEWLLHAIHTRVLTHIAALSEADVAGAHR